MHNMNYGLTLLMYLWVSVCMWVCVCVHTSWNSEAVLDRWTKPWFIRNPSDKVGQVQSVMVFSSRYRFTLPFLLLLLSPDPHSLTLSLSLPLAPSHPAVFFSAPLFPSYGVGLCNYSGVPAHGPAGVLSQYMSAATQVCSVVTLAHGGWHCRQTHLNTA